MEQKGRGLANQFCTIQFLPRAQVTEPGIKTKAQIIST